MTTYYHAKKKKKKPLWASGRVNSRRQVSPTTRGRVKHHTRDTRTSCVFYNFSRVAQGAAEASAIWNLLSSMPQCIFKSTSIVNIPPRLAFLCPPSVQVEQHVEVDEGVWLAGQGWEGGLSLPEELDSLSQLHSSSGGVADTLLGKISNMTDSYP